MSKRKSRITIEDVAREASVSTMTVSRVLNNKGEIREETRQRILKVIDHLGYRPSRVARSLATRRSYILGVVVSDIANPFFAQLVSGAETYAWQQGYNVLLCHTQENQEREAAVLHLLEDTQVDGVLICSTRLPDDDLKPLVARLETVVLLNRQLDSPHASSIRVNDVAGAIKATRHLLDSGRHRIGLIAGPPYAASSISRREGFALACEQAGYPENIAHQIDCAPNTKSGYQATLTLLEQVPDLNGLFCYNDMIALGTMQACKELGRRIPQEIALVGCDDIPLASLISPAMTTLSVNKELLGAKAIQRLIERVEGRPPADEPMIEQQLVIRETAP